MNGEFMGENCQIQLKNGRKLGFAVYGPVSGAPVFLFHGIPGSRVLRHPDDSIVEELGIRLIAPDRPGFGLSGFVKGRRVPDWPADVTALADVLGIRNFAVLGISGGGPYACVCAARLPERVTAAALVSSVSPVVTPEMLAEMRVANRFGYLVGRWAPWFLWHPLFRMYYADAARKPEKLAKNHAADPRADHEVFTEPAVREMFVHNYSEAFRQGTRGAAWDTWVLAREWGFDLAEIRKPVFLWQGEDDVTVAPSMGRYLAHEIRNCRAHFLPGEGHLVFVSHWREVLSTLIGTV